VGRTEIGDHCLRRPDAALQHNLGAIVGSRFDRLTREAAAVEVAGGDCDLRTPEIDSEDEGLNRARC
jgi:hypothetical protein